MTGRDYLGEFEHIIVLALLRLEDRAYGVTVRQEIEFRAKREVSIGAVYSTFDRLEAKGYVHPVAASLRRSVVGADHFALLDPQYSWGWDPAQGPPGHTLRVNKVGSLSSLLVPLGLGDSG